jgi:uncharacterized membrane protein
MSPILLEWLHLLVRWTHVVAAIMWIGDSFLFMWMDRSLEPPSRPREGAVVGELWMVHSGGFYEVVKRRYLAPAELPRHLHWFKWEAYTTWMSGLLLLAIVYFLGHAAYLVDPSVARIGPAAAIAASVGLLVLGWLAYDALWMSPLARGPLATIVSAGLLVALGYGTTHLFSGRAAFLLFGATLGTIMAANVMRRIIPAQTQMLAATRAGTPVNVALGERAKQRSTHNHFLTLPVLFTMLSNHFPSTYSGRWNWIILLLLVVLGVAVKVVMNARGRSHPGAIVAGLAALIGAATLATRGAPAPSAAAYAGMPPVSFAEVQAIVQRRCLTCHAAHPTNPSFPQPPNGVILEDPARLVALAPRILVRAVETRTMPLGNLTGMTEDERRTLGAWIAQGAKQTP